MGAEEKKDIVVDYDQMMTTGLQETGGILETHPLPSHPDLTDTVIDPHLDKTILTEEGMAKIEADMDKTFVDMAAPENLEIAVMTVTLVATVAMIVLPLVEDTPLLIDIIPRPRTVVNHQETITHLLPLGGQKMCLPMTGHLHHTDRIHHLVKVAPLLPDGKTRTGMTEALGKIEIETITAHLIEMISTTVGIIGGMMTGHLDETGLMIEETEVMAEGVAGMIVEDTGIAGGLTGTMEIAGGLTETMEIEEQGKSSVIIGENISQTVTGVVVGVPWEGKVQKLERSHPRSGRSYSFSPGQNPLSSLLTLTSQPLLLSLVGPNRWIQQRKSAR